ncbi:MAG: TetR/AcrR family transcriptional regulator [Lentimonas sp.]
MPSPTTSTSDNTRSKLLQATEKLFAEHGYRAMTMRDVTEKAGVNIAAVNYHFGSKADLMRETIRGRIEPINIVRLRRLDLLIKQYGASPIPVIEIFDTLIRPIYESDEAKNAPNRVLIRMIGRAFSEPADFMRNLHQEFFQDLSRRYLEQLKRTRPDLSEANLRHRFFLSISTMLGATVNQGLLESLSRSKSTPINYDKFVSELVAYIAAGFDHS